MTQTEREQALRDELELCRQLLRDVRMLNRAGLFKRYQDEPWLVRIMNIDLETDPIVAAEHWRAKTAT